jgi:hypothetical protein
MIFVSYASKDQAMADKIVRGLEAAGLLCWISSRDLKPGADYQASIVNALEAAEVVLLLLSRAANESVEVPKEMSLAGYRRKTVIPVRLEDVQPTGALAYQASHTQRIDVFRDFDAQMDALCLHLGTNLKLSAEVAANLHRTARRHTAKRWAVAATVAVMVLAGGAAAYRLLPLADWIARPRTTTQVAYTSPVTRPALPPPSVTPPPAPAMPAPAPVQMGGDAAARAFADTYFATMSGADATALVFLSNAVTDPLMFYGQSISQQRMLATQQAYFQRWPDRSFTVRSESMSVTCVNGGVVCTASGIVDYALRSPARSASANGAQHFTLRIIFVNGTPRLAEVNGASMATGTPTAARTPG